MGNEALLRAKHRKNDELYTLREDIESELSAYLTANPSLFEDKTIMLPCDDHETSNFYAFFKDNFAKLRLRHLTATRYCEPTQTLFREDEARPPLRADYDGETETFTKLIGDGDFRSEEVTAIREQCDIIVTNPPFSLAGDFMKWASEKQFIAEGPLSLLTSRNVFPLIASHKAWLGATSGARRYKTPGGETRKLGNTCWYTNVPHAATKKLLILRTMEQNIKDSPHEDIRRHGYTKYDNYDAIDVPYADAVPSDYDGLMGVPGTFLTRWREEDWEIIGANIAGYNERLGIKEIGKPFLDAFFAQGGSGHYTPSMRNLCKTNPDGTKTFPFQRIIIRRRKGV